MKSKQKTIRLRLFIAITIIFSFGLAFFALRQYFARHNYHNTKPQISGCSQFEPLVQTIMLAVPLYNTFSSVYDKTPIEYDHFPWKFKRGEPFFSFTTGLLTEVTFNRVEEFDKLSRLIIKSATKRHFVLDKLNTIDYQSIALTKGSERFRISSYDPSYIANMESHGRKITISIACQKEKKSKDQNDLIIDEMLQNNPPDIWRQPGTMVKVHEVRDNVAIIDVTGFLIWGGGHADYWGKINNKWQWLVGSQDVPNCQIFEKHKIGKGLDCLDSTNQSNQIRKVL